jgi:hypothetical protein
MIRTAVVALIAASLMGLAFFGGHQSGGAKERARWLELENATLREQAKEITRQVEAVAEKQKEYDHAQTQIADAAVRLRSADRLRVQAEHTAAIERATAESLRTYAADTLGLFEACRDEYIKLGLEAARLAAALGALK